MVETISCLLQKIINMENLIKSTINNIEMQKKRPSMELIFSTIQKKDDSAKIEIFKEYFDELLSKGVIVQRGERDSYYVAEADVNNAYPSLNEIISTKEMIHKDEIIDLLKEQIVFLKSDLNKKNGVIADLISKIAIPPVLLGHGDTIPTPSINPCTEYAELAKRLRNGKNVVINGHRKKSTIDSANTNNNHDIIETVNTDDNHDNKSNKLPSVAIIGDSMLNNIESNGISNKGNVKVLGIPGSTSLDMKDYANPLINRKKDILIFNIGTNDLTNNIDTIPNLQTIVNRIKKKSAFTKIAFSSLITRKDYRNGESDVTDLNDKLVKFCEENHVDYIDNNNIDDSCLGRKGLHPNKKGKSYLAKNFINYINSCK